MSGFHFHKCAHGHEWGHEQSVFEKTEEEYNAAHDCPKCGENVRNVSRFLDQEAEREFMNIQMEQMMRAMFGEKYK